MTKIYLLVIMAAVIGVSGSVRIALQAREVWGVIELILAWWLLREALIDYERYYE